MTGTISSKGQITVPKAVRVALGLKAGDSVVFATKDGAAILRPARVWTLDELSGSLRAYAHKGADIRHGHREALAVALRARKEKWIH
jgi:AbrB family looped-hinge helix DNA binding protein